MTDGYRVRAFEPAWWLRGAHAQTIGGRFLRRRLRLELHRERVDTPDGDFLDLEIAPAPPRTAPDAPVVLVLHGLEGGGRSGYMLALYGALAEHGIRAVGMNFRSCSGEMNRTPRFYHAGETGDTAHALGWIGERFPGAPVGAAGFSLGGNVLLKVLGEGGAAAAAVRVAAAISVPFDLAAGADCLEMPGMGRLYTSFFMRKLLRKSRLKRSMVADRYDADRVARARTIREFDDAATAPLHGFRDAAHYYAESSSKAYLAGIRVPTLLLHSLDDPFLPAAAVPHEVAAANPSLTRAFTRRGGHVGFVAGPPWAPRFWAEREAARFLAAHLAPTSQRETCRT
jgi:predicted alpha/beta-fold hydrolase